MTQSPRRKQVSSRLIEPASYVEQLDLDRIFGRHAPLHVDLGCGDGSFLLEIARRTPKKNFLGIERLFGRSGSAARKAEKIDNARVLRMESSYAVRYLLPKTSVEYFYLLFPDPWPKRRHQHRRVVTNEFLDAIRDALVEGGILHIATDQRDYFEHITQLAGSRSDLASADIQAVDLPCTKFEMKFKAEGAPIYRLELRKVSPVA